MKIFVDEADKGFTPLKRKSLLAADLPEDENIDPASDIQLLNKDTSHNHNKCGGYYIDIGKKESISNISLNISMYANLVLLISSSVLGHGDDQQGSTLMNSFLDSIARHESVPATLVFINSGVFLVSEGSPVLENLRLLEKRGVEIISSASCLEYYQLKDKLRVGYFSNMYNITEKMFAAARVIAV